MARFGRLPQARIEDSDGATVVITPRYPGLRRRFISITRRVVAKVEWHWDQLFPRVGFIVTNMTDWSRKVVKFYNGRGTAEQWIKEGKYAVKWTR